MLRVSDVTALIILLLKILKIVTWPTMSGIKGSKSDSGASKRERKKVDDSVVKSQKEALLRHFSRSDVIDDVQSLQAWPLHSRTIAHRPFNAFISCRFVDDS